jgi:hypothetical protein
MKAIKYILALLVCLLFTSTYADINLETGQSSMNNWVIQTTSSPIVGICPANWAPVCWVDWVTYANTCMAGDVEIASQWECVNSDTWIIGFCTLEWAPVCWADWVTYGNTCMAGNVEIISKWECVTNGLACTREWAPVCWVDWVTYANACMAGNTGINYQWECISSSDTLVCTREWFPVCWKDWVTYANPCLAGTVGVYYQWECSNLSENDRNFYDHIRNVLPTENQDAVAKAVAIYETKVRYLTVAQKQLVRQALVDALNKAIFDLLIQYPTGAALPSDVNSVYLTYSLFKLEMMK